MPAGRSLAFGSADHVLVQVFGSSSPSETEWSRFVRFEAEHRGRYGEQFRALTLSDGGAPTKAQHKQIVDQTATDRPCSVVFTSMALRFTVSVFTLAVPNLKTFSPAEMDAAFAHLGLGAPTIRKVWPVIEDLAKEIGGSKTAAAALAARASQR